MPDRGRPRLWPLYPVVAALVLPVSLMTTNQLIVLPWCIVVGVGVASVRIAIWRRRRP